MLEVLLVLYALLGVTLLICSARGSFALLRSMGKPLGITVALSGTLLAFSFQASGYGGLYMLVAVIGIFGPGVITSLACALDTPVAKSAWPPALRCACGALGLVIVTSALLAYQ